MPPFLRDQYIQIPEGHEDDLLFVYPQTNLRHFSRVMVDADQMVVFFSDGRVVTTMGPGAHTLDPAGRPVVAELMDLFSGGGYHRSEIVFVSTLEQHGVRFGGVVDNVVDPATSLVVTLRTYGEYAFKVVDPEAFVVGIAGNDDWDVEEEQGVRNWVSNHVLRAVRSHVTRELASGAYQVLGLGAHDNAIEEAILPEVNRALAAYGLVVTRMGDFHINLDEKDADRLKRLSSMKVGAELAGSYDAYARSEAMMAAAEGMRNGTSGGSDSAMAMALMSSMLRQVSDQPAPAASGRTGKFCSECGERMGEGAKFCSECGNRV